MSPRMARTLVACTALALAGARCPAGPGTVERGVKVGDRERVYTLHAPASLPAGKPAPLVLVFHGGGGTAAGVERQTQFSALADREGFIAAYPEGIARGWNDGRAGQDIPARRLGVDDLAFVAALLDDIARDHPTDPRRIYATGISNGGMLSHFLGARLSPRIAAVAPVIGGIPEALVGTFRAEQPVSVAILQGVDDPIVPYRGGPVTLPWGRERGRVLPTEEAVRIWVERNGCRRDPAVEWLADRDPADGCRVQKFSYGGGRNGTEVVLYRIEGGGHTWPGGSQYLRERLIGKVCRDLDATEVIWRFFKAHPKPYIGGI